MHRALQVGGSRRMWPAQGGRRVSPHAPRAAPTLVRGWSLQTSTQTLWHRQEGPWPLAGTPAICCDRICSFDSTNKGPEESQDRQAVPAQLGHSRSGPMDVRTPAALWPAPRPGTHLNTLSNGQDDPSECGIWRNACCAPYPAD